MEGKAPRPPGTLNRRRQQQQMGCDPGYRSTQRSVVRRYRSQRRPERHCPGDDKPHDARDQGETPVDRHQPPSGGPGWVVGRCLMFPARLRSGLGSSAPPFISLLLPDLGEPTPEPHHQSQGKNDRVENQRIAMVQVARLVRENRRRQSADRQREQRQRDGRQADAPAPPNLRQNGAGAHHRRHRTRHNCHAFGQRGPRWCVEGRSQLIAQQQDQHQPHNTTRHPNTGPRGNRLQKPRGIRHQSLAMPVGTPQPLHDHERAERQCRHERRKDQTETADGGSSHPAIPCLPAPGDALPLSSRRQGWVSAALSCRAGPKPVLPPRGLWVRVSRRREGPGRPVSCPPCRR